MTREDIITNNFHDLTYQYKYRFFLKFLLMNITIIDNTIYSHDRLQTNSSSSGIKLSFT